MKDSPTLCFVSNQIYPGTAGGIGHLIPQLGRRLYQAGWSLIFLLDVPPEAIAAFRTFLQAEMPPAVAYTPADLLTGLPPFESPPPAAFGSEAYYRAYRLALALQQLTASTRLDGVELADYLGQGYVILQWRNLIGGPLSNVPVWVRLHGSLELCQQVETLTDVSFDTLLQYQMERSVLAQADAWVAPADSIVTWYQTFYRLQRPAFCQPPPFYRPGAGRQHPRQINPANLRLLFYGKFQPLKGADTFVQAAVQLCAQMPQRLEFDLVGGEDAGLVHRFGSYQEKLLSLIPPVWRDRFHFHAAINPADLPDFAQRCTLAVIPSKFETFCLAAHELNWIGIPLILNDLPAFVDYFQDGQNCAKFNGTVEDLGQTITRLLTQPDEVGHWAWNADQIEADPARLYEDILSTLASPAHPTTAISTIKIDTLILPASSETIPPLTGDYVLLLEADDQLEPDFFPIIQKALGLQPNLQVLTTYSQNIPEEDYTLPYTPSLPLLLYENRLTKTGCLFKREIFERYLAHNLPQDDQETWLRLIIAGVQLEIIPLVLRRRLVAPQPLYYNELHQALSISQLIDQYPNLIPGYAPQLLKLYAFERQRAQNQLAELRRQLQATEQEWQFRYQSQHLITQRFAHLTYSNILKFVRHPGRAWRKLGWWLKLKLRK